MPRTEKTVFMLEQKLALHARTGEVEDVIREDNDHHSPAQEASTYIPDVPTYAQEKQVTKPPR